MGQFLASAVDHLQNLNSDSACVAFPDQPLATKPTATIADVLQLLRAQKAGAVLICDQSRLVGIFTERDALKVLADGTDLTAPISSVMSREPVTLSAKDTVSEAIRKMSSGGFRHIPIVDAEGQPDGVLGVHGIVHYLVDHFPNTVYNLPPSSQTQQREREGA